MGCCRQLEDLCFNTLVLFSDPLIYLCNDAAAVPPTLEVPW